MTDRESDLMAKIVNIELALTGNASETYFTSVRNIYIEINWLKAERSALKTLCETYDVDYKTLVMNRANAMGMETNHG